MFEAGEATVDITPPLGIEMAGFHKPTGQERRITGIRLPSTARALVLRLNRKATVALLSIDICGFPADFARRVQKRASRAAGIPASQIRVCATHTHSMPTFRFFRQWGAISPEYMAEVESSAIEAVVKAKQDLASADLYIGQQHVVGGNFNRTAKTWKTDVEFTRSSTDDERWLDTTLHVLHLLREAPKPNLTWYHFSAHPVCFGDELAGPDWPGLVARMYHERDGITPSFLQGHIGDVNPGAGTPWTGDATKVSDAVYTALHHAVNHSVHIDVKELRSLSRTVKVPLDLDRLNREIAEYRADPSQCTKGPWVDAGFAAAWYADAQRWKQREKSVSTTISALRLGSVALVFHPAELYSFYGLKLRIESPFAATIAVGYADDFVGYVTDPKAYDAGEYAAIVVPKILGLPPFTPTAARSFTDAAIDVLEALA